MLRMVAGSLLLDGKYVIYMYIDYECLHLPVLPYSASSYCVLYNN
jgi:hypothetical protein